MKIGDLVRRRTPWGLVRPEDRIGLITKMDPTGYFIMNYYVQWQGSIQDEQLWYREDELQVINEDR